MIFKNEKVYDLLKWLALVCLPAINVFFLTIAEAWQFDINVKAISVTICAVSTLIGALIGISGIKYQALLNTEIPEQVLDTEPVDLEDDNTPEDYSENSES
jgi:hypothetical protein